MVALSPALSLAPRESIYQHLSQTSPDNTNKNISQYSIDPATRYPNINLQAIKASQVPSPGPAQPPRQSGGHQYTQSPVPKGCGAEAVGPQDI